ncbi:glycosyl hydrolase family 61 [Trichoderma cornu-damae]|uniref:lytic cellulose monooxygenase (C4-dehydrogenating) n=1 Tax=Trichoderma cornu-damae TaxID=654480 RepID=A0A9P8QTN4_9HYPO|nr:glycosyl hydrolase family 61 [Trichoderma cornu-damae]
MEIVKTRALFNHSKILSFLPDISMVDYYYQKVNTGSFPNVAGWYATNLGFIGPDAYTTSDIICHKNSAPGAIAATAPAGGTIVFQWGPGPWPHPYGPIITYVAQCSGSCTTVDKTTLRWVKIQEQGINTSTQVWASQNLINQGSRWSVKIPSGLKAGNYVFRHEILAAIPPKRGLCLDAPASAVKVSPSFEGDLRVVDCATNTKDLLSSLVF